MIGPFAHSAAASPDQQPSDSTTAQAAHRILAAKCFQCHGPDAEQREADLRLDTLPGSTELLPSGATPIVPGDANSSELIIRIEHDSADERMPPPDAIQQLSAAERELLRLWIEQGAQYPGHWAFTPHRTARPPMVNRDNWSTNPVDRFILAELRSHGLSPPPRADRYTLIRRLYFDLIGLPPSPEEIRRFIDDTSANAWPRLIDRLLASPHYGERWGRHWLDVARYGDSNGGDENHKLPHAFHYRDYVISAFNADTTYDRFLLEQLAGDLFTNRGLPVDQIAATGFLAIGMKILAEQDPVKKRADMIDEQIDTLGRSLLGLSLGCARCHDHKFDPISTADYYALFGIFKSTELADREVETAKLQAARNEHASKVAQLRGARDHLRKQLEQHFKNAPLVQREAERFERGNVSIDREQYGTTIGIISDPGSQQNYVEYDFIIENDADYELQLRYAAKTARPGKILLDGVVISAEAITSETGGWMPEHQKWINETKVRLSVGEHVLRIESEPMMSHIDKWRLIPSSTLDQVADLLDSASQLDAELAKIQSNSPSGTLVMAVHEGQVDNARIHLRGDHLSPGDEVARRFPEVLSAVDRAAVPADQSGRWQLAEWLTKPGGLAASLSSRVMANRIWHWHFGRGLVTTPDQFGIKGARPTHPELLEYLAQELIRHHWSIKSLHRQILTSNTYQSSSQVEDPLAQAQDPENQWYWKATRRRLEAELIRDAILLHANRLDREMYGAPVQVKSQDPSPQDLEANRAKYYASQRRSIYLPVVRTNLFKFLTLFDFPNSSSPVGRRSRTTVPTQSLWMMNSPFMMEQAAQVATQSNRGRPSPSERLDNIYFELFGRPIDPATKNRLQTFLEQIGNPSADDKTAESTAWQLLCHTLMMSHEFIYVD
ncbi:MAG: DUF1549 domain-containing protein [Pirellulaceae bacterium]|nr:DUF1549 domain-containing protein [Pirellulaceae bacterium]